MCLFQMFNSFIRLERLQFFPPYHLVDDTDVALDDADHFGGDVLVDVVGYGNARQTVLDKAYCNIHALQESLFVDAAEDEASFVEGFGTLCAGADTNCGEGMANRSEETAFLGQCARIRYHCEGVYLKAVIVVEAKRLVLNDSTIELES